MRHGSTIALFAALHALGACSVGKLTGEVDGELVPAFQSGLVFEASSATEAEDYVAVAAFYTFSNACDLVAGQMDVRADAVADIVAASSPNDTEKAIDAVRDFEKENLPEDYWAAYVVLGGENENDIEDDFDIEDDAADVVVCRHTGAVDVDRDDFLAAVLPDFAEPFAKDRNRDCFRASEGEVRVSLYDESKSISLVTESELDDGEGDDAGEIELGAVASYCATTERAVEGLIGELLDSASSANDSAAPAPAPGPSQGGECQFANDGECDEPEGTGLCAEGTDANDCAGFVPSGCQFANDGECDEAEGTGLCAQGTDGADC